MQNNNSARREIFKALAVIIPTFGGMFLMMAIVNAYGDGASGRRVGRRARIAAIDADIDAAMRDIDSIDHARDIAARDSMMRNPEYAFVIENADLIEPLIRVQDSILDVAVRNAQKSVIMDVVRRDPSVFRRFSNLRGMYVLERRYEFNKKFIDDFYRRDSMRPAYERAVRNHFDSVVNARMRARLDDVNEMLKAKNRIITGKTVSNGK